MTNARTTHPSPSSVTRLVKRNLDLRRHHWNPFLVNRGQMVARSALTELTYILTSEKPNKRIHIDMWLCLYIPISGNIYRIVSSQRHNDFMSSARVYSGHIGCDRDVIITRGMKEETSQICGRELIIHYHIKCIYYFAAICPKRRHSHLPDWILLITFYLPKYILMLIITAPHHPYFDL